MKRFSLSAFAYTLALAALTLAGCKKDEPVAAATGEFTLHMDNGVSTPGTSPVFSSLVLGTGNYVAASGDNFTVSTFRYYVSNVRLNKADGGSYAVPNSYFLVDHSDPTSQDLEMTDVPVGDYTSLTFTFGVDSTRSKAGNFTGILNADKGLLWTMNGVDEFINLELKGYSPSSPTGALTLHIAGYQHSTTNTIRTITVPFPTANSPMLVRPDHSPEIHMQVDIAKMFTGPNPVRFSDRNYSSVMGGAPAARIADNIEAGMFKVAHVQAK